MFIATVYRPSEDKLDAHAVFVSYLVHSKRILFGVHRPGLSRLTRENAYCEWTRQIRVYTQLEIEALKRITEKDKDKPSVLHPQLRYINLLSQFLFTHLHMYE